MSVVIGVILARGGSKSVPLKNLAEVGGKSLLERSIIVGKDSCLDDLVVSTDSEKIAAVARKHQIRVVERPAHLASDTATSADALAHAILDYEESTKCMVDYVVELMCTNPFKTAQDVDNIVAMAIEKSADSVIAVHEVGDAHPRRVKFLDDFGRIKDFVEEPIEARRQDLIPKAYLRSGAIYCIKRSEVIEKGRRYGTSESYAYVLNEAQSINIDSKLDLLLARVVADEFGL